MPSPTGQRTPRTPGVVPFKPTSKSLSPPFRRQTLLRDLESSGLLEINLLGVECLESAVWLSPEDLTQWKSYCTTVGVDGVDFRFPACFDLIPRCLYFPFHWQAHRASSSLSTDVLYVDAYSEYSS